MSALADTLPQIVDLHMHTVVSDGTDTPQELTEKVREAGIEVFSITDHDAVEGALEAERFLTEQSSSLRFIRGVEFSCRDNHGKYHILGYNYDPGRDSAVYHIVEKAHNLRMKKVYARLEFIKNEFGMVFPEPDINELFQNSNPGKPHIARLMIKYGYASSIKEAMQKYLNQKKFAEEYIRPEEAISAILESGGIPVLAHPAYGDGDQMILGEEMDQRIAHLITFGLAGMECYYSGFTPRILQNMLALAERYRLYVTAGSDYHGTSKLVQLRDTNLDRVSDGAAGLHAFLEACL